MTKIINFIICLILCCASLWAPLLQGEIPRFYADNPERVMLNGYDVLTYYTHPKPQEGDIRYYVEYRGAKWYFVNKINMNKFKRNPEMYIPEFGGYSVWSIAHGRTIGGDPEIWKLIEGKLYLFCSEKARDKWMQERELINRLAQDNWPAILDKDSNVS